MNTHQLLVNYIQSEDLTYVSSNHFTMNPQNPIPSKQTGPLSNSS